MEFEIIPYEGASKIRFGMSREEVHNIMGEKVSELKHDALWDVFEEEKFFGIQVAYSYQFPNLCKALTVAPPQKAIFQGRDLLRLPMGYLRQWFKELNGDVEGDDLAFISYRFGIHLWAGGDPSGRFTDEEIDSLTEEERLTVGDWVQSVTVFERGFYDEYKEYLKSHS
jgi:hypothetical protein